MIKCNTVKRLYTGTYQLSTEAAMMLAAYLDEEGRSALARAASILAEENRLLKIQNLDEHKRIGASQLEEALKDGG